MGYIRPRKTASGVLKRLAPNKWKNAKSIAAKNPHRRVRPTISRGRQGGRVGLSEGLVLLKGGTFKAISRTTSKKPEKKGAK